MTTKEFMQTNPEANLDWCKPYVSRDGKAKVIQLEGKIEAAVIDGEEMSELTAEDLKSIAKRVSPDYELYSGWSDEHIILEAMTEIGCSECPFIHDCSAMDEEIET